MPTSHLSEYEWTTVFEKFGVLKHLAFAHVSNTQLSIARHYGGIQFDGHSFTYIPATDELIRDDVLKFIVKQRRAAAKQVPSLIASEPAYPAVPSSSGTSDLQPPLACVGGGSFLDAVPHEAPR